MRSVSQHASTSLRRLLLALALPLSACATTGAGTKNEPHRAHGDDEEAGLNRITGLMRDFGRALEAKDFDTAAARLRDAEAAVKNAGDVTRSHPDFEDVEARVARARPRLDEAMERDRIERRNAAIAAVMKKGDDLIRRANILLTELAKRVPEAEDMTNLDDLVNELGAVEREGSGFLDDVGYKQHAEVRDKVAAIVIGRRRQADWQIQTSAAVGKTIAAAFDAVDAAKKSSSPPDQLVALRRASDAFARCVNAIADAASLGGYDAGSVLTTRMGTLAVSETKKRCLDTGGKVRTQADRLAFHERAAGVAKRVDAALKGLEAAPSAGDKLTSAEAAIEALALCQAELDAAQKGPGYDTSFGFDTALGQGLNAEKLRRACVGERTRLVQSLPAWRWRKGFETMKSGLATIKQRIDEATAPGDPATQIQRWQKVLENLASCVEKARALEREPSADGRYAFVSSFGNLTVAGVEKECDRQRVVADTRLAQAVQAQSVDTFTQGCKADEIAVARREGVPTQVVPVDGGRLFVYGKGPGARRFGFDADGKAVDFGAKWREQVQGVATEVGRVLQAVKAGDSGAALLAGTEAALPVMDVCIETLTGTERHPGYDPKLKLATDLGRITAVELRSACARRRGELVATVPTLKWRAALEQIRDRAVEAYMQVEDARGLEDVAKRVKASGEALGGYRECVERAEAMARAPDVDRKATVNGPFGPVNVTGLAKACKAEIANAQAMLDAALAAEKLHQFMQSCKGDEVEVTKREGMPSRIESLGNGRIFVYEAKAKRGPKARRFAFDASGTRVEEAVLRASR